MADAQQMLAVRPKVVFFHSSNPQTWQLVTEALQHFVTQMSEMEAADGAAPEKVHDAMLQDTVAPLQEARSSVSPSTTLKAYEAAVVKARRCGALTVADVVSTLVHMATLAMRLPELLPDGVEFLDQHRTCQVLLTREQCASILAAGLFAALPPHFSQSGNVSTERDLCLPEFDFDSVLRSEPEKVIMLLVYFDSIRKGSAGFRSEVVSFSRRAASLNDITSSMNRPLTNAVVREGSIEDAHDALQADFANEYLGGGVLHGGNVQEEIRFSICPECLVGMLFSEKMLPHETLFIVGALQYSRYDGYGGSFHFTGRHAEREWPADKIGRRGPHIVAFDALVFPGKKQYKAAGIRRELLKAYAACLGDVSEEQGERRTTFATGNWGCGVFGGDPQVKSLIQWLAASAAGREMAYFPFGDNRVGELPAVISLIKEKAPLCKDLYSLLLGLDSEDKLTSVFDYVRRRLAS
eukprot:TRINITY_DN19232_c0_g1_i1.p1 TRINITY_DN19232_c0_g1~~TRINITY_DN19232_c0_g1_i1.p1  ORF type:complete len:466 (+),score=84.23 TRINITY_DN19232_c0_g1_i1:101-1498(+)